MTNDTLAVVADIGGTNTRVALSHGTAVDTASIRRFRNAEHPGIEPILRAYLSESGAQPQAACVDMAGPVKAGVGTLTNLDWRVSAAGLREATGAATVSVLNDMQAQGVAVAHLGAGGLRTLIPGEAPEDAPRLIVNMGTGLNAQPVYRRRGMTLVPPAEAGHVSIPVQNAAELRLRDWVAARHVGGGTPGLEDLLSGRGFERIYAWLCDEAGQAATLPAAEIFAAFEAGEDRAVTAARMVVTLLGRYSGDLALITQPLGGVYLVGGVVRHLAPHLMALGFAEAFADKGRFADFMAQFPVHVVEDDYAALTGCAAHLDELMSEG